MHSRGRPTCVHHAVPADHQVVAPAPALGAKADGNKAPWVWWVCALGGGGGGGVEGAPGLCRARRGPPCPPRTAGHGGEAAAVAVWPRVGEHGDHERHRAAAARVAGGAGRVRCRQRGVVADKRAPASRTCTPTLSPQQVRPRDRVHQPGANAKARVRMLIPHHWRGRRGRGGWGGGGQAARARTGVYARTRTPTHQRGTAPQTRRGENACRPSNP